MKPSAEEFEKLALEQLDLLYRVACRWAGDPDRASDLVQETYLRAFRARDRFDLQSVGIRPWLIRILHNVHLSRGERESRQPAAIDAERLDSAPAHPDAFVIPSSDRFEQMDERLVAALKGLPEEYQVVLLLWAVEELSYKEIAEALEVPIGTVMSRLHRARQRMTESLHDYAREERIIRD